MRVLESLRIRNLFPERLSTITIRQDSQGRRYDSLVGDATLEATTFMTLHSMTLDDSSSQGIGPTAGDFSSLYWSFELEP